MEAELVAAVQDVVKLELRGLEDMLRRVVRAELAIVGTQANCSTQENAGPPTTPCRIVPSPRSEANHNAQQFARLISANKIPLE